MTCAHDMTAPFTNTLASRADAWRLQGAWRIRSGSRLRLRSWDVARRRVINRGV